MPVVDGIIQLPNDGPGKKQDFSIVTTSLGSVYRERINIADPITNNLVNVSAAGGLQVDGSGVTQPVSIATALDVSDRTARLLGHVTVDNASIAVTGTFWQVTQPISGNVGITGAVDVSDRAARLLGIVYGSNAQLKQTATNNNLQTEIAVGAALIDPRSIRALTSADVVDVSDRTARLLGHVTIDNASIAVTGTFWQSTQPVSGSISILGSSSGVAQQVANGPGGNNMGSIGNALTVAQIPGAGSISILQSVNGKATVPAATVSAPFASNNRTGNRIIALVGIDSNVVPTVSQLSDTNGNLYYLIQTQASTNGAVAIYASSPIAGGPNTVTYTPASSMRATLVVYEVAGALTYEDSFDTVTASSVTNTNLRYPNGFVMTWPGSVVFHVVAAASGTISLPTTTIMSNASLDLSQTGIGGTGLGSFAAISSSPTAVPSQVVFANFARNSASANAAFATLVLRPQPIAVGGNIQLVDRDNKPIAGTLGTLVASGPASGIVVLGKSADGTPVFNPIPLAAGSASVVVSGTVTANQGGAPWSDDPTDRAARLLGVVYGSQGQQLKQTATNFNLQTELATGATLYDARQIRALTSGDVVDVSDRSARLVGHVTVDSMPAITTSSSPTYMLDEYSNKIPISDETLPWQQALLDEMRATRLGMQVLIDYLNPASGISSQPLNQVRVPVVATLVPTEVDLMQWAQSIRDGGDELIQG